MGVVGAVVVGVGAAAAAPGDGDQVTACYQHTTGALRVVDPDAGQECKQNESQLEWSTGAPSLEDGSVIGGEAGIVADDTLTHHDLAPNAVGSDELADDSVDTGALATGAVTSGKIFDGTIGTGDLANGAVTSLKIFDGTVDTSDLSNLAVNNAKLQGGAVNSDKIFDGSINAVDLNNDAVTSAKIALNTIATGDLADNAVTSDKIASETIASGDLANGSVTAEKVTANLQTATTGTQTLMFFGIPQTVSSATLSTGPNHKLLAIGQTQLTCTTCGAGDLVNVSWQVFEGAVPVGQEYRSILTAAAPTAPATVSVLIPSSGTAGPHTYQLRVTRTGPSGPTVTSTNDSLSVIDLGR
jgi:hypothetical protein